jgi:hypothetical protein
MLGFAGRVSDRTGFRDGGVKYLGFERMKGLYSSSAQTELYITTYSIAVR